MRVAVRVLSTVLLYACIDPIFVSVSAIYFIDEVSIVVAASANKRWRLLDNNIPLTLSTKYIACRRVYAISQWFFTTKWFGQNIKTWQLANPSLKALTLTDWAVTSQLWAFDQMISKVSR